MRIIAGKWKNRILEGPKGNHTRPTSDKIRQSIFNIIEHGLGFDFESKVILDSFGGTGALGFEALSRGAESLYYFDNLKEAYTLAKKNAQTLGADEKISFLLKDSLKPPLVQRPIDLAFFDPPYSKGLGEKSIQAFYDAGWFKQSTIIVLEESKKAFISLGKAFIMRDKRTFGDSCVYFIGL